MVNRGELGKQHTGCANNEDYAELYCIQMGMKLLKELTNTGCANNEDYAELYCIQMGMKLLKELTNTAIHQIILQLVVEK